MKMDTFRNEISCRISMERSTANKSPLHLTLLPVLFAASFCNFMFAQWLVCKISGKRFSDRPEMSKVLIGMPLLLASIPVGLFETNWLIWIIPPLRKIFVGEGRERGEDFQSANEELMSRELISFTLTLLAVAQIMAILSP